MKFVVCLFVCQFDCIMIAKVLSGRMDGVMDVQGKQ